MEMTPFDNYKASSLSNTISSDWHAGDSFFGSFAFSAKLTSFQLKGKENPYNFKIVQSSWHTKDY